MLKINQSVIDGMIAHAKSEAPIEACGYLMEKDGVVCKHNELTNVDQAEEHYTFDPKEQFAVVKNGRKLGLKPAAVYHSHPVSPARPSEEDIRLAFDPSISYVILSLMDGKETIKSFKVKKGVVEPEEIEIIS